MNNRKNFFFYTVSGIIFAFIVISGIIAINYSKLFSLELTIFFFSNLTLILFIIGLILIFSFYLSNKTSSSATNLSLEVLDDVNTWGERKIEDTIKDIRQKTKKLLGAESERVFLFNSNYQLLLAEGEDSFVPFKINDGILSYLDKDSQEEKELFNLNSAPQLEEFRINEKLFLVSPLKLNSELIGIWLLENIDSDLWLQEDKRTVFSFLKFAVATLYHSFQVSQSRQKMEAENIYSADTLPKCLEREIERADRFQFSFSTVALKIDPKLIDKYSLFNDSTCYHEIITELSTLLRGFDYILYLEEEEVIFIILPHTNGQQAEEICKRINEKLTKKAFYISLIKRKENLSFYWGISSYPEDTTLKDTLLDNCQQALQHSLEKESPITLYKNIY